MKKALMEKQKPPYSHHMGLEKSTLYIQIAIGRQQKIKLVKSIKIKIRIKLSFIILFLLIR